jgi:hypothetical protein
VARRCRKCDRPLRDPRWRAVGLGPVCARRLGLRLVQARPSLMPVGPGRKVRAEDDGQLDLFDIEEGAA